MTTPAPERSRPARLAVLIYFRDTFQTSHRFNTSPRSRATVQWCLKQAIDGQEPVTDEQIGDAMYDGEFKTPYWRATKGRIAVFHANNLLKRYFNTEGRSEPYRIAILAGDGDNRSIDILPNKPPPVNYVQRLWEPYFGEKRNIILFTEPLFFRKRDELTYIRDVYCNSPASISSLKSRLKITDEWVPSYHYVSAGEAMGVLRLVSELSYQSLTKAPNSYWPPASRPTGRTRMFNAEFATANRMPTLDRLGDTNLIVIGSSRTSSVLKELQVGQDFIMGHRKITLEHRETGEPEAFEDETRDLPDEVHVDKYAVLTRKLDERGRCVTLVAANHGRAAQGALIYLTDQDKLIALFKHTKFGMPDEVPAHFQVIFKVVVSKLEGEANIRDDLTVPVAIRVYE
jgi:hypothetical protein